MRQAIAIVFAKEMLDNLRDRRSLFMALIYPFIGALFLGLLLSLVGGMFQGQGEAKLSLAVVGPERAPDLIRHLEANGVSLLPPPANPEAAVREGRHDVVLLVPEGYAEALTRQRPAELQVVLNATRLSTVITVSRVVQLLRDHGEAIGRERLAAKGLTPEAAMPLRIRSVNVGQARSLAGFFLNMLPPFIVFTIFVGGVYLAIDTTSGERERGSLEPLLTNPVPRAGLMLGKAGATFAFTLTAVLLQLVAFKAMFALVAAGDHGVALDPGIAAFAGVALVSLPLIAFAVALQIIVATVSRSYKETQTYLGLLPLIPSLPGMALVFVPLNPQAWMMTIPTFGQVLLIGKLMRGEPVEPSHVGLSMLATGFAASALLAIAARLYDRDRLLFSS